MNAKLKCRNCDSVYPLELLYKCSVCGAALEVAFDYTRPEPGLFQPKLKGMWDYKELLPIRNEDNIVSLGEGGTPLLKVPSLCSEWNADVDLYIKAESLNPTGSFKDRPTSAGVSAAKESGFSSIIVASSGNAAASAAAYAARAGMPCYVIVPQNTDHSKIQQALAYGAMLFSMPGTYSDSFTAGIADPLTGYAGDGDYTLRSVYESDGQMVSLSEAVMAEQLHTIETTTGIYWEPAGSVSVSAVKKLYEEGVIKPRTLAVALMTGSGFKFSHRKLPEPVKIKSFDELAKMLKPTASPC